ncbi:2-hydroxyacyl-CoA dehydratase family protein [Nocardia zapadnayensis]|uniref:2-hydroxyacyl-CoA dehydratase family protein n=1 Tax=Nocardia rhamnosiphila TaxID=426716 RepID=UPI002246D4D2|nr:2-hydroxyacyl-CoA dehydratase family protein [Nocardia zapadnayensis]MCX0275100.1 2-hydroxyacyl-CoA dehydratase family protein [Nocardia zapadnayensis]
MSGESGNPEPPAAGALEAAAGLRAPGRAGSDRPVIGVVGGDVPLEIIEAGGGHAFRLSGADRPAGAEAIRLSGAAVDSVAHSILDTVLTGEAGFLRGLVVSRDSQAALRLFYVLRMLAQQGRAVPEVHLVDLLHLPRASTHDYNAGQLAKLADAVARWTGTGLTPESLYTARKLRAELATALRAVRDHRAAGAVTGATALLLYALAQTRTPSDCLGSIDAVLAAARAQPDPGHEPARPAAKRGRVFLTGSTIDQVPVYDRLEAAGLLVAGEDHNWGDPVADLWDPPAEVTELPAAYAEIAGHRLHAGPMAQTSGLTERARYSADRVRRSGASAVLSVVRRHDPAPGWDRPGLIRELGAHARVVTLPVAAHIWSADEFDTAVELLTREEYEATAP